MVDVNDHAPVIETDQEEEEVRIESARMEEGAVIRRMRASDEDCSDVICSFHIQDLTPDLPFNITDQGWSPVVFLSSSPKTERVPVLKKRRISPTQFGSSVALSSLCFGP